MNFPLNPATNTRAQYHLGNCLRDFFTGEFDTMEEAFTMLSARFLLAYPNKGGLVISLLRREQNCFGNTSVTEVFFGVTCLDPVPKELVEGIRRSYIRW
ncbi:hypothetical protein ACYPKM_00395 [Pseudomonas aeruginosa]